MTCIAGVVGYDGKVYIGGDSAGGSGWSVTPRADLKVFKRGEWAFGFTSSFRMGQIIRYAFDIPAAPTRGLDRFMATTFVDALRKALKEGGFAKVESNVETGGTFLVGLRGRLFSVEDDFQVAESRFPYAAVGCGDAIAVGALYALDKVRPVAPRRAVLVALQAAAAQNGAVRGPFSVVSV